MFLFLSFYIAVYGSLNTYAILVVRRAFNIGTAGTVGLSLASLAMILLSIGIRILEFNGYEELARILYAPAFMWMAIVLWFFFFGLAGELWNLIVRLAALQNPAANRLVISPKTLVISICLISLIMSIWGFIESGAIRIKELSISSAFLPKGSRPLVVTQVTDIHMGLVVRRPQLEKIVALVNKSKPDLVVVTGDTIDSTGTHMDDILKLLSTISEPPLGKYAILGNHEYYAGPDRSAAMLNSAGLRVLRNQFAELMHDGTRILLAGAEDRTGRMMGKLDPLDLAPIPESIDQNCLVIALNHIPEPIPGLKRYDLQLSGHTHGGQIFPFTLMIKMFFHHVSGLHRIDNSSWLYVSRGAGTWGPPIRVFAPPDVTVITINPQ